MSPKQKSKKVGGTAADHTLQSIESHTRLERQHVADVYNAIAPHFSDTRGAIWPLVGAFCDALPPHAVVADVGCGNGKYLQPLATGTSSASGSSLFRIPLAVDQSPKLLEFCTQRGFEALVADGVQLPFRSNIFDATISIAVVHHFVSRERRLQACRELVRVTKPGGRVLVTVWALEQTNKTYPSQDVFIPWHFQRRYTGGPKRDASTSSASATRGNSAGESGVNPTASKPRKWGKGGRGRNAATTTTTDNNNDENDEDTKTVNDGDTKVVSAESASCPTAATPSSSSETQSNDPPRDPLTQSEREDVTVYQRFYHLFIEGELEQMFKEIEGVDIIESAYDCDNWYITAQKR